MMVPQQSGIFPDTLTRMCPTATVQQRYHPLSSRCNVGQSAPVRFQSLDVLSLKTISTLQNAELDGLDLYMYIAPRPWVTRIDGDLAGRLLEVSRILF